MSFLRLLGRLPPVRSALTRAGYESHLLCYHAKAAYRPTSVCLSVPNISAVQRVRSLSAHPVWGADSSSSQYNSSQSGSREPNSDAVRKAKLYSVMMGSACAFFGGCYILYYQLKLRAEEASVVELPQKEEVKEEGSRKKRVSFHDQRVIGYENRIRAYSTPDKIFRYFATLRIRNRGSVCIYMTPDDFLRSITPGIIQPEGLGLDQFRTITTEKWIEERSEMKTDPDSVFSQLGHHGLISFSDYLFLLTILSAPMRNFEMAFKMFDLNGDGEVDFKEFDNIREVIMNSTAIGERHRDHLVTGNIAGSVDDALVENFFGRDKKDKLTVEKFQAFHRKLRMEILKLEFNRFEPEDGRISERDFAKLVLSYASMNDQRKKKHLKRVKRLMVQVYVQIDGITFEDVRSFAEFLDGISDVEMALSMYSAAGSSITVDDLKQVAKAVTGVSLSDHLVEVIFTIFDENNDNELSYKEFIKVMKSRTTRGLEKPKELGFAKAMNAMWACAGKTVKDQLGIKN